MAAPIKDFFKAKEYQIQDIYERPNGFTYEIPRYQRPYSWKKNQIEKFYDTISEDKESFLGTIIFNVDEKESNGIVKIIDGQQRYITLSIFGAVLRDLSLQWYQEKSLESFKKLSETFQKVYIGAEDDYKVGEYYYYLKTGISTESFFEKNIQKFDIDVKNENLPIKLVDLNTLTAEEKLIREAYFKFESLIKTKIDDVYDDEETFDILKKYRESLGKLFLVKIEIKDNILAHEIFESVNDSGVDLSVSDLIKNMLFLNMPNDGKVQDDALENWSQILENLDSIKFPMKIFLSYYWASKYKYLSDSRLYNGIKNELKQDKTKWKGFMLDLVKNSELIKNVYEWRQDNILKEMTTKHRDQGVSISDSITLLRNTNTRTWSLLILSIFRNKKKFIDYDVSLSKLFKKLEKFTFYYHLISSYPSNWYFSQMHAFARKIENTKTKKELQDVTKELDGILLTRLDITFESFELGFKSIVYKDTKEAKSLIYYIFNNIEAKLNKKVDYVGFAKDLMTIEHFLPLKPKEWGFKTVTSVKPYVNYLGNLMLIPNNLNSILGNKPCDEKLQILKESEINLKHVQNFIQKVSNSEWSFRTINAETKNFDAIKNRQRALAKLAFEIWVVDLKKRLQ